MSELRDTFEAFLSGDDTAFAALYREMNPRLSAYAHKIAPGHADDLMQELWERVIAMRANSDHAAAKGVLSPLAFLFRMAKNLAIDEYRKVKDDISLDEKTWDLAHPADGTEEHTTVLEALILEAFEKLHESDREILALNFYSGYKYGEIADMLGMTNDAVWQRASRARKHLKAIVEADARRNGVPLPMTVTDRKKEAV